jgi:DNA transformation protein
MHERNAKVRRRIAAGKFRLRIRDLRNLGPRAEQQLAGVGIHSAESLRRRGALAAYMAVTRANEGRGSLNLLWALVGALEPWPEGRDWREVAASKVRLPLLLALEAAGGAGMGVKAPAGGRRVGTKTPKADLESSDTPPVPWVPGMPFEGPSEGPIERNRRPAAKRGRGAKKPSR